MKYPSFIYNWIKQGKDEKKRHLDGFDEYPEHDIEPFFLVGG